MSTGSMTKAELVEEVSRVSDLTKKHSEVIVDTVFKSIIDALHRGEKIELRGAGRGGTEDESGAKEPLRNHGESIRPDESAAPWRCTGVMCSPQHLLETVNQVECAP